MAHNPSHIPKGTNPTITTLPSHHPHHSNTSSSSSPTTTRFAEIVSSSTAAGVVVGGGDDGVAPATPSCVLSALLRRTLFDAMSSSGSGSNNSRRSISGSSSSSSEEERQTAADGVLASLGITQGMPDIRLLLQQAVLGGGEEDDTTTTPVPATSTDNNKNDDDGAWLTRMFSGADQSTISVKVDGNAATISPQARLEMLSRAGMADVATEVGTSAEAVENAVNFLLRQSSSDEFGSRLSSAVDRVTNRILSRRIDVPVGSRFNDIVTTTTTAASSPSPMSSLAQPPSTQQHQRPFSSTSSSNHHPRAPTTTNTTTLLVRKGSQQTPPPTPPHTQGMRQQQQWRGPITNTTTTTTPPPLSSSTPSPTAAAQSQLQHHHHTSSSSPLSKEFSLQVLEAVRVLHSNGSTGPRPSYTLAPLPTTTANADTISRSTILTTTATVVPISKKPPTTTILRQGSNRSSTVDSSQQQQDGVDVEVRLSLLNDSVPSSSNLQVVKMPGVSVMAEEEEEHEDGGRGTSPHVLHPTNTTATPAMDVREINPLSLVTSTPITASSHSASFYPSRELALACKGYDKQLEYATVSDATSNSTIVTSVPLRNRSLVIGADRPSTTSTTTESGEVEKHTHFDGRKVYNTFLHQVSDSGSKSSSSLLELMRAVPEPHTRNLYVVADPCLPITPFFDVDASEWDTTPLDTKTNKTSDTKGGASLQHSLIQPLLLAHNIPLPDTATTATTSAWSTASVEVITWLVSKCIEEAVGRYFGINDKNNSDGAVAPAAAASPPVSIFSSCAPIAPSTATSTHGKVKLSLHLHFPSPQNTFANIQEHRLFVEKYLLTKGCAPSSLSSYPTFTTHIAGLLGVDENKGRALLGDLLHTVIDAGVYTKWRLFRLPFCCKGFSFASSPTASSTTSHYHHHATANPTPTTDNINEEVVITPMGRTSSSAALETLQEKDIFTDQLNNYHHHNNGTSHQQQHHRLVTAAKDVLSCGFTSRRSLRFLLPLITTTATSENNDSVVSEEGEEDVPFTHVIFTPLRELVAKMYAGVTGGFEGRLQASLQSALLHPFTTISTTSNNHTQVLPLQACISEVETRITSHIVPMIQGRVSALVAQSVAVAGSSSSSSSTKAEEEDGGDGGERTHMAQEALKCELSYLQRVCRVSNELMAVGITLQPHQQQHHNRTTTKVETASTNVLLAPVLPNSESQLDALLGGGGWQEEGDGGEDYDTIRPTTDTQDEDGLGDAPLGTTKDTTTSAFANIVFGKSDDTTTSNGDHHHQSMDLTSLLHYNFLEGGDTAIPTTSSSRRQSSQRLSMGMKRARESSDTNNASSSLARLLGLPEWAAPPTSTTNQSAITAATTTAISALYTTSSSATASATRASGGYAEVDGLGNKSNTSDQLPKNLSRDQLDLLRLKSLFDATLCNPRPPFQSGRRITISSAVIRQALADVWRCLHAAYDHPQQTPKNNNNKSATGASPSSPTDQPPQQLLPSTTNTTSFNNGGDSSKNAPIVTWNLGTCQYEDNGNFRSYYIFQKCNKYCLHAGRSHKSTYGQLYLTYNSIKYRCYSNDCYQACHVVPWRASSSSSSSSYSSSSPSYPNHDRLTALRSLLFPDFARVDIQQRYSWIVDAPKTWVEAAASSSRCGSGGSGGNTSEMGGDSSNVEHDSAEIEESAGVGSRGESSEHQQQPPHNPATEKTDTKSEVSVTQSQ